MHTATFRIQRLVVEGFKAFTTEQSIEVGNRHLFIFGQNGHGKSSLVETIRWCLFGLADRPDVEVANVFYSRGECKVELALNGPHGVWSVLRRLRPGSGRSDLVIRNPRGEAVPQSEVFPHLARLGPREGTHIIFASQQSTTRRPQADIDAFDKVLYSYLKVEEIPPLLDRLRLAQEEQEGNEGQLARKMNIFEGSLRIELNELKQRIEEISRAGPWPAGVTPTTAETEQKLRAFVKDCSGTPDRTDGGDVGLKWLSEEAERAIHQLEVRSREDLQEALEKINGELMMLAENWRGYATIQQQLNGAAARVAECESQFAKATNHRSREQAQRWHNELVARDFHFAKYTALMKAADEYYTSFSPPRCPVCAAGANSSEIRMRLRKDASSRASEQAELAAALAECREQLRAITEAEAALQDEKANFSNLEPKAAAAWAVLRTKLDTSLPYDHVLHCVPEAPVSYQRTADRLRARQREIQNELDSAGSMIASRRIDLRNLQTEMRLHAYRRREEVLLDLLENGLNRHREAHREFLDLLDSLREIRDALQGRFNAAMDETLPGISNLMSNVYGRLTQQASFPRIVIQAGPSTAARSLHLKVTSDWTPGEFFEPSQVLNGQAFSALNLVPYFVFSKFQAEALELDCLLIDDPSQSFDTSRIELLLQELASAASHAQLIVASHEADRFEGRIDRYFPAGSYEVVRVTNFTRENGPTLEREC